jgi:integrase
MEQRHLHKFEKKGNYLVCECGNKRLDFQLVDGKMVATREGGKVFTKKTNKNRFLFPLEYMKLEDALKDKQKHSIKCLLHTGARIDELQHVLVKDFIYNPDGRSRIILRKTKTKARKGEFGSGRTRDIPVSKQFSKYLFNYIKDNGLSEDSTLRILSNPAINICLKKTGKEISLINPEDLSAHTFRKTLEVWLMALGIDSLPLTAHLGHDVNTAAAHYVSPDIFSWEDKQKIRQIIGDLYLQ